MSLVVKILLDEMYEGFIGQLRSIGHEVYSVQKLKKEEERFGHDFNIINYAKDNQMVLITNDSENGRACIANGFPCIYINTDKILDRIILPELQVLENDSSA